MAEAKKTEAKTWSRAELEKIPWDQMSAEQFDAYEQILEEDFARAEKAEREMDRLPTAWRPKEDGEKIAGVIIGMEMRQSTRMKLENYDPVPVYTIRTREGLKEVWALHQVLREALEEQGAAKGKVVAIQYLGKIDSGRGYSSYKVKVA